MLKLLGLVCVGVFVSAAYYELKQIGARKRDGESTDGDPAVEPGTTDEKTDDDGPPNQ